MTTEVPGRNPDVASMRLAAIRVAGVDGADGVDAT
jgi:hypothetical protein